MFRRVGLIAAAAGLAALAVVTAASARPAALSGSCELRGVMRNGADRHAGAHHRPGRLDRRDQLHWAQFFIAQWNKAGNKPKLKLVQGDTQLDPAKASTVAQSFASNSLDHGRHRPGR